MTRFMLVLYVLFVGAPLRAETTKIASSLCLLSLSPVEKSWAGQEEIILFFDKLSEERSYYRLIKTSTTVDSQKLVTNTYAVFFNEDYTASLIDVALSVLKVYGTFPQAVATFSADGMVVTRFQTQVASVGVLAENFTPAEDISKFYMEALSDDDIIQNGVSCSAGLADIITTP